MRFALALVGAVAATTTSAQLLTNGNSQLPACASTCTLLNQAAQACGGTAAANQAIWACFCQSGYLVPLYTSGSGICEQFCPNPTDNQQVETWYKSNCGTDHGASEHADPDSGSGATTVVITSTSTAAAGSTATTSTTSPSSTAGFSGSNTSTSTVQQSGGWFSTHWKWVVMLIVLFVGLLAFALIAFWLKRRHDRKKDLIRHGFNAGITSRSGPKPTAPPLDTSHANHSQKMVAANIGGGNGRNSPARTREAFMPYGYGYARSESRLASHDKGFDRITPSPLGRGATPVGQMEKGEISPVSVAGHGKKTIVRDRDSRGFGGGEKS
ncbi:Hypothetical protein R9X50_00184600 [Acrodontium crateriforme]|uniref:Integral membrane protein n=1 Tax=Acrodontium crateriforme TaxID=150365 RepID=A0AAQ3M5W0_9PEZI|nr:Hypothetical protein R9X50_00184600 [Acrodontium crateriforme]